MLKRIASLFLCLAASLAAADVTIRIDPGSASKWTVDRNIFGRFMEELGREAYPGIYADHLVNGSFEDWFDDPMNENMGLLYEVHKAPGVAFPWEALPESSNGAPGPKRPQRRRIQDGVHGAWYQRLQVEDPGFPCGVRQRIALPDERVLAYDLKISVRGSVPVHSLAVRLKSPDGASQAAAEIPLTTRWARHTVRLRLPRKGSARYAQTPFGEYELSFVLSQGGYADLDFAMLLPADAVNGRFNPETIRLYREFNVTNMRWPGGNWASAYHWRDGVGPLEKRPVRANIAWGGVEPNYLGTDEFLEFCRLTGMEAYLNVAFSPDVPPSEAAAWVEYVNGAATTPMGRLRAANGHPEPWGVKNWQVGNEVWGHWQVGHASAEEFAAGFRKYRDAMKAVDPGITVMAQGLDPGYLDLKGPEWNNTLFRVNGKALDGIDIHRYERGAINPALAKKWPAEEYSRTLMGFPAFFERLLSETRESAAANGIPNLIINVGEWNLTARGGWPGRPGSMAHAVFVAGMFDAFLRQGAAVHFSHITDYSLNYRPSPHAMSPFNPAAYVQKVLCEPVRDGGRFHSLALAAEGPVFSLLPLSDRVRAMDNVPFVDSAGIISERGDEVFVFLANRNLRESYTVELAGPRGWNSAGVVMLSATGDVFAPQTNWERPEVFQVREWRIQRNPARRYEMKLPPAAVARVQLRRN